LSWIEGNALEPSNHISQYGHAAWTRQAGQIPGAVFALTQTSDGNLWVGTEFGLLRFDGTRFLAWQPPAGEQFASTYITALAAARDGSLWIGTREGLCHSKGNRFETYRTSRGAGGPGVAAILEDRRGTVWVGTSGYRSGGLCQVQAHSLNCVDRGLAGVGVVSLFESHAGDLWAGGTGGLTGWTPGFVRLYGGPFSMVESASEDESGRIWVSTHGEIGVSRLVGEKLEPYRAAVTRGVHPGSFCMTATEDSGSEPVGKDSCICIKSAWTSLHMSMASRMMISAAFSKIMREVFG